MTKYKSLPGGASLQFPSSIKMKFTFTPAKAISYERYMDGWCVSFDRLLSKDIEKIEEWIVAQGIDTWAVYDNVTVNFVAFADENTAMLCYLNFS